MDLGSIAGSGGGLTSSSSADGDNTFGGNAFDYRNNNGSGDTDAATIVIGVISFIAGFIVCKAVS